MSDQDRSWLNDWVHVWWYDLLAREKVAIAAVSSDPGFPAYPWTAAGAPCPAVSFVLSAGERIRPVLNWQKLFLNVVRVMYGKKQAAASDRQEDGSQAEEQDSGAQEHPEAQAAQEQESD